MTEDTPTIRYDKNPDGTYTVVYGDKTCQAKDQIEAGQVLAKMMFEDTGLEPRK